MNEQRIYTFRVKRFHHILREEKIPCLNYQDAVENAKYLLRTTIGAAIIDFYDIFKENKGSFTKC